MLGPGLGLGLLRGLVLLQVVLAAAALCWALLGRGRAAGDQVKLGRLLLIVAVVTSVTAPFIPISAPFAPPAKLWSALDRSHPEAVASIELPGMDRPVAVLRAKPTLTAGLALVGVLGLVGAAGLARVGLGVRALLAPSVRWRRVRGVEIRVSPATATPCTLWLLRPVIVLDPDTFADEAARFVAVRHELQHQRAGDAVFAWFAAALGALTPANPAAVWLRRQLVEREELACDAALLAAGVEPRSYAELLLAMATRAGPHLVFPGLVSAPSLLQRRISMLILPSKLRHRSRLLTGLGLSLAIGLLCGLAWAGDRVIADHRLDRAALDAAAADLAPNTALPVVANAAVAEALERMVGTPGGQRWVKAGLVGHAAQGARFEAALSAAGLPVELAAVPLVESGYRNMTGAELSPSVPANQRGAGYWMFIATTARQYGLRVDDGVDERLDIDLETGAAVRLFSDLHQRYGDWGLALAAYNQGPQAVDAAIASGGTRDVWALQEKGLLNDYVAQVIAAAVLIDAPTLLD